MGTGSTGARVTGGIDNEAAQFVGARIAEIDSTVSRAETAEIFDQVARVGAGEGRAALTTSRIDSIIRGVIGASATE